MFKCTLFLYIFIFYVNECNAETQLALTVLFGKCPGSDSLPIVYGNVKEIFTNSSMIIFNYDTTVKRNAAQVTSEISVEKCAFPNRPDTCFHFKTFKTGNICNVITSKLAPWATFVNRCMKPKLSCPFKKGVYKGTNCIITKDSLSLIPSDDSYWMARFMMKDSTTKTVLSCINFEGHM